MHDLEAWKTSPAPIPFTIRAWTRPHSARLSEPAADGGQTGARPPTDAAQRVGASANPPVRHVSALYVRVGIPPPLLLSSDTSFARAALGFFPLPHTEAIAFDSTTERRVLLAELPPAAADSAETTRDPVESPVPVIDPGDPILARSAFLPLHGRASEHALVSGAGSLAHRRTRDRRRAVVSQPQSSLWLSGSDSTAARSFSRSTTRNPSGV